MAAPAGDSLLEGLAAGREEAYAALYDQFGAMAAEVLSANSAASALARAESFKLCESVMLLPEVVTVAGMNPYDRVPD